jgi:2-polyprenyl-3-methyl-5-hydroxy-6-metoxy-1,4-benzoquinol methylase
MVDHNPLDDFAKRIEGRTLVVGSRVYGECIDRRKLYSNAVGLDQFDGEGVDIVHDLEKPLKGYMFDHIDIVSVLEHVKRPWALAKNIDLVMNRGATILVSVPFVWRIHSYPGDYWRITHEGLEVIFPNVRWKMQKFLCDGELRKLIPRLKTEDDGKWLSRSETVAFGAKV